MSLGQMMHRHAGQLDTTGRIESLPKGRPDIEDSHDPRIDGLAIVDTAISVDTLTREDLPISAVEGGKETRVRQSQCIVEGDVGGMRASKCNARMRLHCHC